MIRREAKRMKKAKKKGKSYSQGWFERQSKAFQCQCFCASSMLSTSVANTAAFAAATSEGGDERQEFSLEKEVLRQAIRDAAKKGKTVKEDALRFPAMRKKPTRDCLKKEIYMNCIQI